MMIARWFWQHQLDAVYAVNLKLPPDERYKSENIMLVSICFSKMVSQQHLIVVIGGDPQDHTCSSVGGSLRRMWPECPGEVLFKK